MKTNRVMMQAFEWYLPNDSQHYKRLIELLDELKAVGIMDLWIAPPFKGQGTHDVGYGCYDLFDLGEFDQHGTIPTKYGTKEELIELIEEAHKREMKIYADVVLNHKAGADTKERFMAVQVDAEDRTKTLGEPRDIEAWTGFTYPNRNNKYSDFKWNYHHFTGVDYDELTGETGIYRILGENKDWSDKVSSEKGNYDYLMFADVNLSHPEVKEEIYKWIQWFVDETKVDGLRLDALKHMDEAFIAEFTQFCKEKFGESFYLVGEYWSGEESIKSQYLDAVDYNTSLFDVGLHFKFYEAALQNEDFDLRTLISENLVNDHPTLSVTFVDNHDSQMGQGLESWVGEWFKPHAYAVILMREKGYPCVFWGDYYGIGEEPKGHKEWLDKILRARQKAAYGDEDDYLKDSHTIGWIRHGNSEHPQKSATLISNSNESQSIRMFIGQEQAGAVYVDTLWSETEVLIDEEGYGEFIVPERSVAIYLIKE